MLMFKAVLSNADHQEYGQVSVPFPIPEEQYDEIMEMLAELELGDVVGRDCQVDEIRGIFPSLKLLEGREVNIDELDYLAQRLDSYTDMEAAQFQGVIVAGNYHEMRDLINLTFCCQQATVITDFSDLNAVGRDHYMNLHGGCAPIAELERLDGEGFARDLIDNTEGWITPYGVVYDNGMELEQLYTGGIFPPYSYRNCLLEVEMISIFAPEDTREITLLELPMAESKIPRLMQRAGIGSYEDMRLRFLDSQLPEEVDAVLDMEMEDVDSLNEMCQSLAKLETPQFPKMGAAVLYAQPRSAAQVQRLAEHLGLFDFIPQVSTPLEYGRYMIRESGHFEYDENLNEFYDYENYAFQRIDNEGGQFNARGYVVYCGEMSLDELMRGEPEQQQGFQMGGMA